jgi:hypothetical protein
MVDTFQQLQRRTGQEYSPNPPSNNSNINSAYSTTSSYNQVKNQAAPNNFHQEQSVRSADSPNPYEEKFHSEFCFISLVLGIFGLILPLFSTLAIIFGIGGLMQTHRERMKGKWMAVAGIILGVLGIVLIIIAILLGVEFLQSYMLSFGGVDSLIGEAYKFAG